MQTNPTTDRHLPLRMNHVVVQGPQFTLLEKRRIAMAFNGVARDKEQAAAEGVSPTAIKKCWEHIADKMNLQWGHRSREHTMAELCRRHLVEFLCIILLILPAIMAYNGADDLELLRKRRGGRRSRGRFDTSIALDIDTLDEITDWPAWLNNQQQRQQHSQQAAQTTQTLALACTPLASIALGVATGFTLFIIGPQHPIFPAELAAETLGATVGLITHRKTNF